MNALDRCNSNDACGSIFPVKSFVACECILPPTTAQPTNVATANPTTAQPTGQVCCIYFFEIEIVSKFHFDNIFDS